MTRVERIGSATLYLGDNADVMPTLARPAALIGDPPYGQRHRTNVTLGGGRRTYRCGAIGEGERVLETNRRVVAAVGSASDCPFC